MQKVVVITGCSEGGIGYGLAQECAAQGHIVIGTARRIEAMQGLQACGCKLVALDVCWPQDKIKQVIEDIVASAGRIDVLINNAGVLAKGVTPDTPIEASRKVFDVNYFGVIAVTQAVTPHMMARGSGTIVNVGSVASFIHSPLMADYGASKAALASWTYSLRFELAPFGVKAVLLAPGYVVSHMSDGQNNPVHAPPPSSLFSKLPSLLRMLPNRAGRAPSHATPLEVFARQVVPTLLSSSPPAHVMAGSLSRETALMGWFAPHWLKDYLLSRHFKYWPGVWQEAKDARAAQQAAA